MEQGKPCDDVVSRRNPAILALVNGAMQPYSALGQIGGSPAASPTGETGVESGDGYGFGSF
jgi:hypothetical protein